MNVDIGKQLISIRAEIARLRELEHAYETILCDGRRKEKGKVSSSDQVRAAVAIMDRPFTKRDVFPSGAPEGVSSNCVSVVLFRMKKQREIVELKKGLYARP